MDKMDKETFHPEFGKELKFIERLTPDSMKRMGIICGGDKGQPVRNTDDWGFRNIAPLIKKANALF